MEELVFLRCMNRGRHSDGAGPAESQYSIFHGPIQEHVTQQRIFGDEECLTLELTYGEKEELRLHQEGTNLIIEESAEGQFRAYLEERTVKYLGQVLMCALQFKIADLTSLIERGVEEMKELEDTLDAHIDNSSTYQILDFRRKYTEYGNQVIGLKEIMTRLDKGYYPMQMQNSYVQQGQAVLEFQFLEERYELIKDTVMKDLDTYTSIVNNNINRNTRLLSLVSLAGVALNFMFGSLLALNPIVGIAGGVVIGGLTAGAAISYRKGGTNPLIRLSGGRVFPAKETEQKSLPEQKRAVEAPANAPIEEPASSEQPGQ